MSSYRIEAVLTDGGERWQSSLLVSKADANAGRARV